MTAPTKTTRRPKWLTDLLYQLFPRPSIIESEYEPPSKGWQSDDITKMMLKLTVGSLVTATTGYLSAHIFPAVLAYGGAEKAAAAFIGNFLYAVCQSAGGSCAPDFLLGGLATGLVLVVVVYFVINGLLSFKYEHTEADEIQEHLKLIDDKLAEIYYALPTVADSASTSSANGASTISANGSNNERPAP